MHTAHNLAPSSQRSACLALSHPAPHCCVCLTGSVLAATPHECLHLVQCRGAHAHTRLEHGHNLRSTKLPSSATIRNVSVSSVAASKAKPAAAPAWAAACDTNWAKSDTSTGSNRNAVDSWRFDLNRHGQRQPRQGLQDESEALVHIRIASPIPWQPFRRAELSAGEKDLSKISAAVGGCRLSRLGLERNEDDVLRLALHLDREDASRPRECQHLQPGSGARCQLTMSATLLLVSFSHRNHSSALTPLRLHCCSHPHELAQIALGLPDALFWLTALRRV